MLAEEVFVGREEEISRFYDFLEKEGSAFVVVGEPGIGKSSLLKEIKRRLRSDVKRRVVVGFHEVPHSANIANPFVGVLDDLMANLRLGPKEKAESALKRAKKVCKKILVEEGRRMAKAVAATVVVKLFGERVLKEAERFYKEWKKTPMLFSLADEIVSDYKTEFIYGYLYFFEKLVRELGDIDLVLVIDQFERAPMSSDGILLDLIWRKSDGIRVVLSFRVEENIERFDRVKAKLPSDADVFELRRELSVGEIGEWVRLVRDKELSYPELKKIRKLSGGFPFLISEWLKSSEKLDPKELKGLEEERKYCTFIRWRLKGLSDDYRFFLNQLSVLLQELPIKDYAKLMEISKERCGRFSRELAQRWVLSRLNDTFWFRHELTKSCFEMELTSLEREKYHLAAASLFQEKYDSSVESGKKVDFTVGLGCAYHFHHAGVNEKSLEHNMEFADFCWSIGALDTAESCYLSAIDDAEVLKDENSKMVTKGNLARVYMVWGRVNDALKTHQELLQYFKDKKDHRNEAQALHLLAVIEQAKGNYDEAEKLYRESLEIAEKLGDRRGIAISYGQLGRVYEDMGKLDTATEHFKKALSVFERIGDASNATRAKRCLERVRRSK